MSKANTAHFKAVRRELAEELGYDPDNLSALETMRVDVVFGLKSTLDEMRRRLLQGEKIDVAEMRAIADTLERFLPANPEPALDDPRDDPHERLMRTIDNWISNRETEKAERAAARAAQGLPPLPVDLETAQREIEQLREENQALKFWAEPDAKALPEGGRVIDVPTSAIVPPSEQTGGRNLRTGPQVGLDNPKPPVTIDGKALPPGAMLVDGKIVPIPPVARSGAETKASMERVNSNRALDHQIMNAPSRVSGEPEPSLGNESWRFRRGW
jgi:hypothetical protein